MYILSIIFLIIAFIILESFNLLYEIKNERNKFIIIINASFVLLSLILLFWIIWIKI